MKRRTVKLLALVACLAVTGAVASMALAHTKRYPTTMTVKRVPGPTSPGFPQNYYYRGRLTSAKPACEKNRTVIVTAGASRTVKTDASGRWEIIDTYFDYLQATAYPKVLLDRGGHDHSCKGTSKVVNYPPAAP